MRAKHTFPPNELATVLKPFPLVLSRATLFAINNTLGRNMSGFSHSHHFNRGRHSHDKMMLLYIACFKTTPWGETGFFNDIFLIWD